MIFFDSQKEKNSLSPFIEVDAWWKNAGKPRREHTSQAVSKQLPWLAMTEKAGPLKKGKEVFKLAVWLVWNCT